MPLDNAAPVRAGGFGGGGPGPSPRAAFEGRGAPSLCVSWAAVSFTNCPPPTGVVTDDNRSEPVPTPSNRPANRSRHGALAPLPWQCALPHPAPPLIKMKMVMLARLEHRGRLHLTY